ncbi:beta-glucosidase-like glycosyl hydrolase [Flavobacteriaceae bacterium MAR_2010_72]|nr:beta-glucosidase-like glycosyl hydrolase [Flavobacteriaceae bacterium MAR_2010_72]TVZ58634.1 beta-glucosidase-like glycosyl hydrolase [Flavobacteriaceae bacterium MAR_2010_105]
MNKILVTGILSLFLLGVFPLKDNNDFKPTNTKTQWVDSIYKNMSLEEKVGHLFMVASYSNRDKSHVDSIQNLIKNYGIGGLIFFQGGPVRQANLTNVYQSMAKVPLLIGMDAEWGLNMRLDSTSRFPFNMTLGAIKNDSLIKRIGQQIGRHCKRLGVHLNFAPVVDINTNSNNPIIGVRSFGEDKLNVTNKALAFTEGLQSEGVLACAKHFPGHGDTATDSHKTLPTVAFSKDRIDSLELYPYKALIKMNIAGVMVAHLNVPSLEQIDGLPSSLSFNIVSNILKQQLAFKGLVFTDALNMKGAANYKEPGDIDLAAFKAGNDVLLFTENAPKAISKIIEAYKNNEITEERLAHSVKKILGAKYDVNLNQFTQIETNGLVEDLNKYSNIIINKEAISKAITVVKNEALSLPIYASTQEKIAFLKLGDGHSEAFLAVLKSDLTIDEITADSHKKIVKELKNYDKVIIGYHRLKYRETKPISNEDKILIETISKNNEVILNVFASQYSLKELTLKNIEGIIISYENSELAQSISAQMMLGNINAYGKLPASINDDFQQNYGLEIKN